MYIEFDSKYMMVMQVQKHKVSSGFNAKVTMVPLCAGKVK